MKRAALLAFLFLIAGVLSADARLMVNQLSGFGAYPMVSGLPCTPAYATGDRTSSITVTTDVSLGGGSGPITNWVDGGFADNATDSWFPNGDPAVAGSYIQFAFSASVLIIEAKMYQDIASGQGTWQWYGSASSMAGTGGTAIGSTTTWGGTATTTDTAMSGNTTAYQYYELRGVSGNLDNASYEREIEFSQCTP